MSSPVLTPPDSDNVRMREFLRKKLTEYEGRMAEAEASAMTSIHGDPHRLYIAAPAYRDPYCKMAIVRKLLKNGLVGGLSKEEFAQQLKTHLAIGSLGNEFEKAWDAIDGYLDGTIPIS